jgi:hypothetical protein
MKNMLAWRLLANCTRTQWLGAPGQQVLTTSHIAIDLFTHRRPQQRSSFCKSTEQCSPIFRQTHHFSPFDFYYNQCQPCLLAPIVDNRRSIHDHFTWPAYIHLRPRNAPQAQLVNIPEWVIEKALESFGRYVFPKDDDDVMQEFRSDLVGCANSLLELVLAAIKGTMK